MHVRRVGLSILAVLVAAASPLAWVAVGPTAEAEVVQTSTLPSGVEIHPVGEKIADTGQLPINIAFSPDGSTAVTADSGPRKSLTIIDAATRRVRQTIDLDGDHEALFYGLRWIGDAEFRVAGGPNGLVMGFARDSNGNFVRGGFRPAGTFISSLGVTPDGDSLLVDQSANELVVSLAGAEGSGRLAVPVGDHPQDVAASKDGAKIWVSNWGAKTVSVILHPAPGVYVPAGAEANAAGTIGNTRDYAGPGGAVAGTVIDVGDHPSELLLSNDGTRLYVTNGNDDTVSVIDTSTDRVVNTINLAPYPNAPKSTAPQGLALTPDDRTLFVANGGNDDVAVVDTATAKVRGLIPAGWYPSAVAVHGDELWIVNAKGDGPLVGFDPACGPDRDVACYHGGADPDGTVYAVPLAEIEANLPSWTADVMRYNRFDTRPGDVELAADSPLRNIHKVIYIVRENKTFDQEFSDIPGADAEPKLLRYGRDITPNNHAMAERWALLNRFYVNTETSIIGHQYSNAGQLSDYTQRTFGNTLGWTDSTFGRAPDEGILEVSFPSSGYLVDDARRHGRSVRIYGLEGGRTGISKDAVDKDLHNIDYPFPVGFDSGTYPDTLRGKEFIRDVKQNGLADFSYLWLPADHTAAGIPGQWGPNEQVASNDLATGMVLDYVSHTPWWKETAVFVVEDDPQSGRDHVSPYRSLFMGASPWMKRGYHSSEHYSVPSVLRTIELALGLPAMSQNEHSATPMLDLFTNDADLSTYELLPAPVPPAFNPPVGEYADRSLRIDLTEVDRSEAEMDAILEDMLVRDPVKTIPIDDRYGTTAQEKWLTVMNHDGAVAELMPDAAKPDATMRERIRRAADAHRVAPPKAENEASELREWAAEAREARLEAAAGRGVLAAALALSAFAFAWIFRARVRRR